MNCLKLDKCTVSAHIPCDAKIEGGYCSPSHPYNCPYKSAMNEIEKLVKVMAMECFKTGDGTALDDDLLYDIAESVIKAGYCNAG